MDQYATKKPRTIPPFEEKAQEPDAVELNACGEAIIELLGEAAQVARMNEERATDVAQKLSSDVHAAQDRLGLLQREIQQYDKGSRFPGRKVAAANLQRG